MGGDGGATPRRRSSPESKARRQASPVDDADGNGGRAKAAAARARRCLSTRAAFGVSLTALAARRATAALRGGRGGVAA